MLFLLLPPERFLSHHLLNQLYQLLFVPVLLHYNHALHKNQSVPASAHRSMLSPADKKYWPEPGNRFDQVQSLIDPKSAKYFHPGIILLSDTFLPVHSFSAVPFWIILWKMYLHLLWRHPSTGLPAPSQKSSPHAVLHSSFQHARHRHRRPQYIISCRLLQSFSFFAVCSDS